MLFYPKYNPSLAFISFSISFDIIATPLTSFILSIVSLLLTFEYLLPSYFKIAYFLGAPPPEYSTIISFHPLLFSSLIIIGFLISVKSLISSKVPLLSLYITALSPPVPLVKGPTTSTKISFTPSPLRSIQL